ncbi:MAG: SIR2 family NAD-dependent protein deacylase [Lachnospiraceae bacterium]
MTLEEKIELAKKRIEEAEVLVIGGGSGLSTAAGLDFGGARFQKYMSEFGEKYGYQDMYSGDFYPYDTLEEYWAFEAKTILVNRYDIEGLPLYRRIFELVKDKEYFVLTTNVESQFAKSGFPKEKIFATQGDYSYFQCAKACHNKLYYNEVEIREMVEQTKDCKIPTMLLPTCPICGGPIKVNLRADQYFIEDDSWDNACDRYKKFIADIGLKKVVYLEFGVGYNTPGIIRYPFEQMTFQNPNACLIRFNKEFPSGVKENVEKTICFTEDISGILDKLYQ